METGCHWGQRSSGSDGKDLDGTVEMVYDVQKLRHYTLTRGELYGNSHLHKAVNKRKRKPRRAVS